MYYTNCDGWNEDGTWPPTGYTLYIPDNFEKPELVGGKAWLEKFRDVDDESNLDIFQEAPKLDNFSLSSTLVTGHYVSLSIVESNFKPSGYSYHIEDLAKLKDFGLTNKKIADIVETIWNVK